MVYAILSWAIVLPLHVIAGYYLATRLRDYTHKLLIQRFGFQVPCIPVAGTARFTFFFFLIPGLPYAAKNYLLPIDGAPFRYCVWMNIALQGGFGDSHDCSGPIGCPEKYSFILCGPAYFIDRPCPFAIIEKIRYNISPKTRRRTDL